MPDGSLVTVSLQQRVVRAWSDPLAAAHPQWLIDLPRRLRARATASAGRRVLQTLLRQRVPLPPLADAGAFSAAPWALGSAEDIYTVVDRAGWLILRPWAQRAITRRQIEVIVACVGHARYENVFAPEPSIWLEGEPDVSSAAAREPGALAGTLRATGWCALDQTLSGSLSAVAAWLRLVTGPRAMAAAPQRLAIDEQELLRRLAAPEVFAT